MTSEQRPAQTFEEWWIAGTGDLHTSHYAALNSRHDLAKAAWDAAIASQQAEIERLNRERIDPATGFLWSVKAESAEQLLSRYEAVVEAARGVSRMCFMEGEPDFKTYNGIAMGMSAPKRAAVKRMRAALAALDEKPAT